MKEKEEKNNLGSETSSARVKQVTQDDYNLDQMKPDSCFCSAIICVLQSGQSEQSRSKKARVN